MDIEVTTQIEKLRRFALAIGLVLFIYAIAGVELESPAIMHPLGIPLRVKRPDLLGIGLLVASAYATLRYWFYAMALEVSPMRARRRIARGQLPSGQPYDSGGFPQQTEQEIRRYLPSISRQRVTFKLIEQPAAPITDLHVPLVTRIFTTIETLDYLAPVLVNVTAVLAYMNAFQWGYLFLRRLLS